MKVERDPVWRAVRKLTLPIMNQEERQLRSMLDSLSVVCFIDLL